ncbi:MAG: hypothetical protein GQ532_04620 [Methylomarinum sp.]|nr:hypothetical protein [Methylomarinum sp.]
MDLTPLVAVLGADALFEVLEMLEKQAKTGKHVDAKTVEKLEHIVDLTVKKLSNS